MKKVLSLILALMLILGNISIVFGAADAKSSQNYTYSTSTLKKSDTTNEYSDIKISLNIPNYLGTIKAELHTTEFSGTAEVLVIYVPNDKWDNNCYYNGIIGTIKQGANNIATTSDSLISWQEYYNYGFIPMKGGYYYVDKNSLQMSFLNGPGLYTALAPFGFTKAGKEYMSAAGFPFVLVLDDDTINYFNVNGRLTTYASYDWPELKTLLGSTRKTLGESGKAATGLANFKDKNTYIRGLFMDVNLWENRWYDDYVIFCFRKGLMVGSGTYFNPEGTLTVAQAITIAARLNNIYYGGSGEFTEGPTWYSVYVSYAQSHGMLFAGQYGADNINSALYNQPVTRAQMMGLLKAAVPEEENVKAMEKSLESSNATITRAETAQCIYKLLTNN